MKKGNPTADRPAVDGNAPRKREHPFFSGTCSAGEHFRLAVENRELRSTVGPLRRRLARVLGAAKRVKTMLSRKVESLETRVRYLEAVLSSTDAAVIVADVNGKIRIFNHGAENIFQMGSDDAVGDNLFRLCADFTVKDERRYNEQKLVDTFLRERSISNMRIEFIGTEGKVTPTLFTLNFVEDENERVAVVAVIKDNSELESLTRTDELTGIANRRHLLHMAEREYARMERDHYAHVSLLFFDVDDFGSFNKEYGHQIGDDVLRMVGRVIGDQVRWLDTAGRYGGEEFVVVMPGTDEDGAAKLAERIRESVRSTIVPTEEFGDLSVTISIGYQTHAAPGTGIESLVREANTAMLVAKLQGKDRVLRYSPEHTDVMRRWEASQQEE